jgi:hypothetical protein
VYADIISYNYNLLSNNSFFLNRPSKLGVLGCGSASADSILFLFIGEIVCADGVVYLMVLVDNSMTLR